MRERHCRPHLSHGKVDSGVRFAEAFLRCLFSSSRKALSCSAVLQPILTEDRHLVRSLARSSQLSTLILHACRSRLHTSLKRRSGRPVLRVPWASWPYRRSFGRRSGPMRRTCPSQRSLFSERREWIDGIPALRSTSWLVTLSRQEMFRSFLMHRMWNWFSLRSWRA